MHLSTTNPGYINIHPHHHKQLAQCSGRNAMISKLHLVHDRTLFPHDGFGNLPVHILPEPTRRASVGSPHVWYRLE
jgi:hypothetical protein